MVNTVLARSFANSSGSQFVVVVYDTRKTLSVRMRKLFWATVIKKCSKINVSGSSDPAFKKNLQKNCENY